jgi:plastocyanin
MHRARQSSIAAVVALALCTLVVGACGGDDDDSTSTTEGKSVTVTDGEVTVIGRDVVFDVTEINTKPGPLTVTLVNDGAQQHSFRLDEPEEFRIEASAGQEDTGTTGDLPPGTYQYYCDIPGHRATMHGQLVVK